MMSATALSMRAASGSKLNSAETSTMILLDSDVLIDLLRRHPPAVGWFDALREDEELVVSGYVVMN